MIYKEVEGDLFSAPKDCLLVHCISADFALGAGIAVRFRNMGVKERLIETGRRNEWDGRGYCVITGSNETWRVANLVTKERYYHKPTYKTLLQALENLRAECIAYGYRKIAMPFHIACGLDGLEWSKVREYIKTVFIADTDMEIAIYCL